MILRDANAADRETLWRFMASLQDFEAEYEPNRLPGSDMAEKHLDALLDWVDQHYAGGNVIAEIDSIPVGWAMFGVVTAHGFMVPEEHRLIGQLSDLWVEPDFRGRGIAKALIAEAEKRFREAGIRRMQIASISANTKAIDLYKSLGYAPYEVSLSKSL